VALAWPPVPACAFAPRCLTVMAPTGDHQVGRYGAVTDCALTMED
jgi:hypothetical protein